MMKPLKFKKYMLDMHPHSVKFISDYVISLLKILRTSKLRIFGHSLLPRNHIFRVSNQAKKGTWTLKVRED
jgi:hypothetical protein